MRTRLNASGTRLVCCSDDGVEVLDIADPRAPREVAAVAKPNEVAASAAFVGDDVYLPRGRGVERLDLQSGELIPVGDAATGDEGSFGRDIIAHGDLVATVGRDHGLHLFRRVERDRLEHLAGFGPDAWFYSSFLSWDDEGPAVIDVGEGETLCRILLARPEKPQKQKLVRVPGASLAPAALRRGDELLLAGLVGGELLIAAVDPTTSKILRRTLVKGFTARRSCSDSMRGLVAVGDLLLVASYARRLYVVEPVPA
ncbi:MAG: hypothetical protein QM765_28430 [Myxococcales bacterium]